jgi:hypothetical protein
MIFLFWDLLQSRLKEDDIVHNVFDVKTEEIGPGEYRFKAEIGMSIPGPPEVKNGAMF